MQQTTWEGGSRGRQHLTWVEFDVGGNTGSQEGNAHRPGNGLLIVKDLKPVQVGVAKELAGYRALKPAGRDRPEQGLPSFAPAGQLKRAKQKSGLVLGALKIGRGAGGAREEAPLGTRAPQLGLPLREPRSQGLQGGSQVSARALKETPRRSAGTPRRGDPSHSRMQLAQWQASRSLSLVCNCTALLVPRA